MKKKRSPVPPDCCICGVQHAGCVIFSKMVLCKHCADVEHDLGSHSLQSYADHLDFLNLSDEAERFRDLAAWQEKVRGRPIRKS